MKSSIWPELTSSGDKIDHVAVRKRSALRLMSVTSKRRARILSVSFYLYLCSAKCYG